jgi:hypothetical protein
VVVFIDYIRYICDYNQMEKLTEQELNSLRELNKSIVDLKNLIADYEIKKHYATSQIMQQGAALSTMHDQLTEKYGDVEFNIETGEYVNTQDSSRK